MNRCLNCNSELSTGDFNGLCSKCRGASYNETSTHFEDVQNYFYADYRDRLIKQAKKNERRKIYKRKAKWNIK